MQQIFPWNDRWNGIPLTRRLHFVGYWPAGPSEGKRHTSRQQVASEEACKRGEELIVGTDEEEAWELELALDGLSQSIAPAEIPP